MADDDVAVLGEAIHELRNIFCIVMATIELVRDHPDHQLSARAIERAVETGPRFEAAMKLLTALRSSTAAK